MSAQCPHCQRVLYNRRLARCGYCGALIPVELRFTPEEIATLDRKMAEWEAERLQRERLAEADAKQRNQDAGAGW